MYRITIIISIFLALLTSCTKEINRPFEDDVKEMLRFLPKEIDFITYSDQKSVKDSKYMKFLHSLRNKNIDNLLNSIQNKSGQYIKRISKEVMYGHKFSTDKSYLILKGDFSYKVLEKGFDNSNIQKPYSVFFDQNNLIIISDDSLYINSLKNGEFIESYLENNSFSFLTSSIKYKNHFWIASNNGRLVETLLATKDLADGNLANITGSINFVSISIDVKKELKLNTIWVCKDYLTASLLKSVFTGLIPVIQLSHPNDEFNPELEKMKIENRVNVFELFINLNEKGIEKFKKSYISNKLKINFE